ncbi:hypothetical protein SDC9_128886 [bioreactor metagenome]|uniref:Undecaprenyl-phosphate 4-deoxy-4-formamido-L-arabinose transferase n=1 Tax=bioreactor metagenome TaxID=1076179 RepID=A0A645CY44_9ZZZZ
MGEKNIWCVIPVYNNAATVAEVAARAAGLLPGRVLVVDDGSSDWPEALERRIEAAGATLLHHERNRGKGAALLTAAAYLERQQADYMITVDADGQHYPEDMPVMLEILNGSPYNEFLLVGCRDFTAANIPDASRFGRRFSNFWFRLETGRRCDDTQSGFRAYPVGALLRMRCFSRHYNFETEALVRGAWGGLDVRDVPIRVYYPEPEKRVSHFRKFKDNFRISLLHVHLLAVRLCPLPRPDLSGRPRERVRLWPLLRHPGQFFRALLRENSTPEELALAAAMGTLLAVLPLVGCHIAVILYVATRFRLNRIMALAIQNLFMPPLSPFLCIELGYFFRHGRFWTELTLASVTRELPLRLYEWLLGSLVLAPLFALLCGGAVWLIAAAVARRMLCHGAK